MILNKTAALILVARGIIHRAKMKKKQARDEHDKAGGNRELHNRVREKEKESERHNNFYRATKSILTAKE